VADPKERPILFSGSMVRAAAVRSKVARELAAGRDRRAAAHLAREAPQGCAWALFFELGGVAVLCTRPSLGAPSNPNAPTPPEAA